jgi:hypothetical protein
VYSKACRVKKISLQGDPEAHSFGKGIGRRNEPSVCPRPLRATAACGASPAKADTQRKDLHKACGRTCGNERGSGTSARQAYPSSGTWKGGMRICSKSDKSWIVAPLSESLKVVKDSIRRVFAFMSAASSRTAPGSTHFLFYWFVRSLCTSWTDPSAFWEPSLAHSSVSMKFMLEYVVFALM